MTASIAFDEAAFDRVVKRYKNASEKVTLVQRGLVEWAMKEGIKEAQNQIKAMVYSKPARSGNVYKGGKFYGVYATRRTGTTLRAISAKGSVGGWMSTGVEISTSGTIHVDRNVANRKGFYYPWILEHGMRKHPAYYPRPFWSTMANLMRARYAAHGREALRQLHQQLRID
jgi:hypothetical protein